MPFNVLTSVPTSADKPKALGGAIVTQDSGPRLLMLCAKVTTATATVRLYRYDEELGEWIPSAVAAQVLDPAVDGGLYELRFNTAGVSGYYVLVRTAGTGTVTYVFRGGRN
jgi:hypothetical protein